MVIEGLVDVVSHLALDVNAQIVETQHRHLQERRQITLLERTALHLPLHLFVLQVSLSN